MKHSYFSVRLVAAQREFNESSHAANAARLLRAAARDFSNEYINDQEFVSIVETVANKLSN